MYVTQFYSVKLALLCIIYNERKNAHLLVVIQQFRVIKHQL